MKPSRIASITTAAAALGLAAAGAGAQRHVQLPTIQRTSRGSAGVPINRGSINGSALNGVSPAFGNIFGVPMYGAGSMLPGSFNGMSAASGATNPLGPGVPGSLNPGNYIGGGYFVGSPGYNNGFNGQFFGTFPGYTGFGYVPTYGAGTFYNGMGYFNSSSIPSGYGATGYLNGFNSSAVTTNNRPSLNVGTIAGRATPTPYMHITVSPPTRSSVSGVKVPFHHTRRHR